MSRLPVHSVVMVFGSMGMAGYAIDACAEGGALFSNPAQTVLVVVEVVAVMALIAVAWFVWKISRISSERRKQDGAGPEGK